METGIARYDEFTFCPIQLRTVRKETLEYVRLRDGIAANGILTPITCRIREGKKQVYLGLHRIHIGYDLRLEQVPYFVREASDNEIQLLQIDENNLRVETLNVEYARRLWRLINVEKCLTIKQLSIKLHQTQQRTREMLSIAQLCPEAEAKMAEDQLPLSFAVELAKLPHPEQRKLLSVTGGEPNGETLELLRREARHYRQGQKTTRVQRLMQDTYALQPRLRKTKELLDELEEPTMMASVFEACNAKTPSDYWKATLRFVWQLDPETYERRKLKTIMENL